MASAAKADVEFEQRGTFAYLGEDIMNNYYRQMGAPGATSLRYHIYPRESLDQPYEGVGPNNKRVMYFTGSRTAVRAGVAMGTSAPPGERD